MAALKRVATGQRRNRPPPITKPTAIKTLFGDCRESSRPKTATAGTLITATAMVI